MAGETAAFSLVARDARGNLLRHGGTALVLEAKVCVGLPGETKSFGVVRDNGDGTYACEYRLTTCGPTELLLTVQDTMTPLVCTAPPPTPGSPHPVSPGPCVVFVEWTRT
jgi:hypothetical protein